ncbi:MAG: flavodoxin family protein [Desulfarculaceae bacterium]|jgi:multimeric flavodoxin WrbA
MHQPYVLGLAGSIRSRHKEFGLLLEWINKAQSLTELKSLATTSGIPFANSDLGLMVALWGARQSGAKVEIAALKETARLTVPGVNESKTNSQEKRIEDSEKLLLSKIRDVDGVILSTPVYFGDRSSVANKLLQLTSHEKILADKVFGVVAVGAKRNGGQETTLIYCLMDALAQGALAVGNGPKTCQYGGTIVAGDAGKALEDSWGIERAGELGRQVAKMSSIAAVGKASEAPTNLNLMVLMTMDRADRKYANLVKDYMEKQGHSHNIDVLDLIGNRSVRNFV